MAPRARGGSRWSSCSWSSSSSACWSASSARGSGGAAARPSRRPRGGGARGAGRGPRRDAPQKNPGAQNWNGPYLKKAVPKDSWGNPYKYRCCPGQHGEYDLWSEGADGAPGGEGENADIVSWDSGQKEAPGGSRSLPGGRGPGPRPRPQRP